MMRVGEDVGAAEEIKTCHIDNTPVPEYSRCMKMAKRFGDDLKDMAASRNLTMTALAQRVGVNLGNLSNIASAKRPCGLSMAVRLADALDLYGAERMRFLQSSSLTTKCRSRTLDRAQVDYPSAVRDVVVHMLSSKRIFPDDIISVGSSRSDGMPRLRLKNGAQVTVSVTLLHKTGLSKGSRAS